MSSDFVELSGGEDKMRRFLSRRPSLRLLAAPILLLAAFTVVGLMTNWIDWSPNKNCSSSSNFIRKRSGDDDDDGSSIQAHHPDESIANRPSLSDWRRDSDQAYARSMNESSFSSSQAGAAVCPNVVASQADIDTMQVYPTLNFQVGNFYYYRLLFFSLSLSPFHDQSFKIQTGGNILTRLLQILDVKCNFFQIIILKEKMIHWI